MAIALNRDVRKILEKAVREARKVSEGGAQGALDAIGVGDAKPPAWLTPEQSKLRIALRAHGRALGDKAEADGAMRLARLRREIAYQHWHRALFARFLAENNLLVDVASGNAPVTLQDVREIAEADGRDWAEVAADYAKPMLPEIFRNGDPVLDLKLPPETNAAISKLVVDLPPPVFKADDSLGWVYQFWQADEKARVNEEAKRGTKIGADELPAVTQLFTEDYMVLFLLENTLGAWWAGKRLAADPDLAANAADEDELRRKLSLPGYAWTYLRFVREDETGPWRPAAGVFEGWPREAKAITMLDPCMGSGHFLVFALSILIALRMAEEGLDEATTLKAVLRDNLHGLEIDPRCTQIAAFALALASWKRLGGVEPLPKLNLACSGLAIGVSKPEFLKLAERIADAEGWTGPADLLGADRTALGDRAVARRRAGLERLYDLFEQAPYLGSLIDPRRAVAGDFGDLFAEGVDGLEAVLGQVLAKVEGNPELRETAVTAQGLAKAAELLSQRFTLVATNVPYLGRGKQHDVLKIYADDNFSSGSSDLTNIMILKFRSSLIGGGSQAIVSPANWYFVVSYRNFRMELIQDLDISFAIDLGPAAFDDMNWWAAHTALTIFSSPTKQQSYGAKELPGKGSLFKSDIIVKQNISPLHYRKSSNNPDLRILVGEISNHDLLEKFAMPSVGLQNGDTDRYILKYWELSERSKSFEFFQITAKKKANFAGLEGLLRWEEGLGSLATSPGGRWQGVQAWGNKGITIRQMDIVPSIYCGDMFDQSNTAIIPKEKNSLEAVFCFLKSEEYRKSISTIDSGARITTSTMTKVPFDLAHWQKVAAETYPNGLPKPHSNDPTQWLFDGHPRGSADPNTAATAATPPALVTPHGVRPGLSEHPLQVAVARLLGYRWPRQTGSSFMDCPAVPEPDEIDRSGLVDMDGIVALPSLAGERSAAERLSALLGAAWGSDWGDGVMRQLFDAEGSSARDLDGWLRDEFFEGHCRLFHQTPFIWHIWDGLKDGFGALVNYHKLCAPDGSGRRLLEKLRDTTLGDWIAQQTQAASAQVPGAEDKLLAAQHLAAELTRIINGEAPYDIFVRWKPLSRQAVGWEPDIDDGVRLNIRPFLTARVRNGRSDRATILRTRPSIHWKKDRGGEPRREKDDYPWFWAEDHDVATTDFTGGEAFKGARYNDFHYSLAAKRAARAKAGS